MSAAGVRKLELELKRMKYEERPAIVAEIKRARELGDLSENAEYHAAKEAQTHIERKISEIEFLQKLYSSVQSNVIETLICLPSGRSVTRQPSHRNYKRKRSGIHPLRFRQTADERQRLYNTLIEHRVGNFDETGDIRAIHIVARRTKAVGSFDTGRVDRLHDVLKPSVDLFAGPTDPHRVL